MVFLRAIQLPQPGLEALVAESVTEGYHFLERMEEVWTALYGAFDEGRLVAIGGLTPDPYVNEPGVGRLRRIYVKPSHRKHGIGSQLVTQLVSEASKTFKLVRLRAENAYAARLYERIGFQPMELPNATHILIL